jgi:2-methylcitrate dehydratase PrpD
MSLRYCVAAALLEGQALPPQFADGKLADPAITGLAGRIELELDPALDKLYPERFAAWIAVEEQGKWVRVDVLDPTGSDANPIGAQGVVDKFKGINPGLQADAIADAAFDIERRSVKELLALLAGKRAKQLQTA